MSGMVLLATAGRFEVAGIFEVANRMETSISIYICLIFGFCNPHYRRKGGVLYNGLGYIFLSHFFSSLFFGLTFGCLSK